MNVNGPSLQSARQSYGHNDDIHVEGNLPPNDSGNNAKNVHHSEANISSSNDHYLSEIDIEMHIDESNWSEEDNEPQTDDEQSSYEDSVKCTSQLKSLDVDETFVVPSIVGKSILHKEKLSSINKLCQPSKEELSKKKTVKRD